MGIIEILEGIAAPFERNPFLLAAATGVGLFAYNIIQDRRLRLTLPEYLQKDKCKKDVVYLCAYPRGIAKSVPNVSPFAVTLETWLRLKNIEHQIVPVIRKSRRNQIPYVFFNGEEYPDCGGMMDFLSEYFKMDSAEGLNPEQLGVTRAIMKMVEENTIWTYYLPRYVWQKKEFAKVFRPGPWPFYGVYQHRLKVLVSRRAYFHGIGRHTEEEMADIAGKDLRALSAILGSKQFLMGDRITAVDCVVFGHLCQVAYVDMPYSHKQLLQGDCANLQDYIDRVRDQLFPDWDEIVPSGTFD